MRFVWIVCDALGPELKPASASAVTISAPVNVPARAATLCASRLSPVDIGVRERVGGVVGAAPDSPKDEDDHERRHEDREPAVHGGRAQPENSLADVGDG